MVENTSDWDIWGPCVHQGTWEMEGEMLKGKFTRKDNNKVLTTTRILLGGELVQVSGAHAHCGKRKVTRTHSALLHLMFFFSRYLNISFFCTSAELQLRGRGRQENLQEAVVFPLLFLFFLTQVSHIFSNRKHNYVIGQ